MLIKHILYPKNRKVRINTVQNQTQTRTRPKYYDLELGQGVYDIIIYSSYSVTI